MNRQSETKPGNCQVCGSGGGGDNTGAGRSHPGYQECDEHISTILRQIQEIEHLKEELHNVSTERDSLLCEVGELKCEMQAIDLKRITNVHTTTCRGRSLASEMACYNGNTNSNSGNFNNNGSNSNSPSNSCAQSWSQALVHKSCSIRTDDVMKRSRLQAGYELSQDLLDKQIELLERKYGGELARNAALTIQRAFRRFTLVRKFATITAMAKAEKRLSRRMTSAPEKQLESPVVGTHRGDDARTMPSRSMSMRERRNTDVIPLVRSQSGRCDADNYPTSPYYTPHFPDANEFDCDSRKGRRSMITSPLGGPGRGVGVGGSTSGRGSYQQPKVPPEVPKRTSSITTRAPLDSSRLNRSSRLSKSRDNGSASSVHSSGSDSSLSAERNAHGDGSENDLHRSSPIWKRKGQSPDHGDSCAEYSLPELSRSHTSAAYQLPMQDHVHASQPNMAHSHTSNKVSETVRKRQYRVGLNLFNKKPEKGIAYLIRRGFLENSPAGVSRFLISRKGLSKQMIGEYLGNLQNKFNMAVLECFCSEQDFSEMQVDVALRRFQTHFRMPGEAQKISHLMEVFASRYCQCDVELASTLRSPPDTVLVLSFAIVMLNTDLHTPNMRPERRMKLEEFIKNVRGIDLGSDVDRNILIGIYERVKQNEFKPGSDHVTQVMKVQATIVGKKPNLALPHRRLVCYCRLYEIPDIQKKERPGVHQREVFLFNDLLVITKILNKKKGSTTYTFRQSFPLCGMLVTVFSVQFYQFGIRLCQRVDNKELVVFNARNEHDRCKFAEDLRESINEMDDMESLRIDAELERQKSSRGSRAGTQENRDSGVADVEVCLCTQGGSSSPQGSLLSDADNLDDSRVSLSRVLRRTALSNSLLDIHLGVEKPQQRRGSMGSLDSGMSISFPSMSTSAVNHDSSTSSQNNSKPGSSKLLTHQPSFLGSLFAKRERKQSKSEDPNNPYGSRSTDV